MAISLQWETSENKADRIRLYDNNTTTYDLLADVATMTDASDEKGFCILKQTPLPFPLKELHIQLPLVQEGEGTPSLDNPRPFKRYDSITIARPTNGSFLFSLADVYKKMNTTDFTISEDGTITGTSLAFKSIKIVLSFSNSSFSSFQV
jgi:hypothetical protein